MKLRILIALTLLLGAFAPSSFAGTLEGPVDCGRDVDEMLKLGKEKLLTGDLTKVRITFPGWTMLSNDHVMCVNNALKNRIVNEDNRHQRLRYSRNEEEGGFLLEIYTKVTFEHF